MVKVAALIPGEAVQIHAVLEFNSCMSCPQHLHIMPRGKLDTHINISKKIIWEIFTRA